MKKKMDIENIVKDRIVYFLFYHDQYMYYGIDVDDEKLMFPVHLGDVENTSLFAEEKATTYKHYISKAIDTGQFLPQTFIAVLRSQALPPQS